ncbi:MAG: phosphoribosylamine--glycine ligase [Xanthomonadales bacterium]|nr:phosphoribosylamine--glycine ligase [Gammaproteobacteria bacterium]MBT8054232.1 phosphoribosylamine--glycine ligase [Gammaproteobacteria bacterium]NND57575.1 phosphoribosylamine--glycine ligase [Xanthomonadales bacterium]NNK51299.1 phosphoribosylamine--glycine ligase [Xanthomonadales bacterium]
MRVMIVGSGGREHALAWQAVRSANVDKVFAAPGNAGTAGEPGVENVAIPVSDLDGLVGFAREQGVDLTIVGPEDPLVNGIVDRFGAAGLNCFGPSAAAAQLEGSKSFAKDFMSRHGIPTAAYGKFTEVGPAIEFIRKQGAPIVVKADGLAAGKGVIIAETTTRAEAAVLDMLAGNAFGEAGHRVVIEEFLVGEEASFIVMADGKNILPLATSQDHKARDDGDTGPNTGGMGAYSPAPVVDDAMHLRVMDEVIRPTVEGMASDGAPFSGFLYAGLMISPDGNPRVLEYNVRFGDPETQPILMRLQSSLPELCLAAVRGRLDRERPVWDPRASLGVVMAAGGYPGDYAKGHLISGLDNDFPGHVKVFHAGTALSDQGVVTSGGRVLCVCALGRDVTEAQAEAYRAVRKIHWDGSFTRSDIGYRAVARELGNENP